MEEDYKKRLKRLILFRLFLSLPLFSAIFFIQAGNNIPAEIRFSTFLYGLSGLFFLSFCYSLILFYLKKGLIVFAYFQLAIDTLAVTGIIFLTGGFYSVFPFLYFVVIIYSSMLLYSKGSLVMASFASVQYGILIDFEYYALLTPIAGGDRILAVEHVWSIVFYKILFTMVSCFAVAILSSLLAVEARKAKKEVLAMEAHVKRVDKMAAIGEMAAGLAHEIKNPLASLSGAIQLLKDSSSYDPEDEKLMKIALREADRLSSLLNDFLMFARPKTGNPVPLELAILIEEVLDLFENNPEVVEKVTIVRALVSGIFIEMDRVHLQQVIINLLMNAAQAIESSGTIVVRMVPTINYHVCLEIIDDGCGMSDDTTSQIFDPFFTTKSKGIGLGLSIVHRILETASCRLDVASKLGEGTTFTLNFKIHSWEKQPQDMIS